jgi:putative transposase
MPRTALASQGGYCYHVLNRGNGRRTVFRKDGDFAAFLKLMTEATAGDLRWSSKASAILLT